MIGGGAQPTECRVLFVCDADTETGFGHASRCLHLSKLVGDRLPRGGTGWLFAFQGHFSAGALARLASAVPDLPVLPPGTAARAEVAVIDSMSDTEDPDAWDPDLVDDVRKRCRRVIFLASGNTAPQLPDDVECIGYQPGGPTPCPPAIRWGFEYAPVAIDDVGSPTDRDSGRALIALGGSQDDLALNLVLEVVGDVPEIKAIDLLVSPVNEVPSSAMEFKSAKPVFLHRNISSVTPLLSRAGLVVASYGHLGWEALALGAPLCLIGQKRFQADLAGALASAGLAVSAGLAEPGANTRLHQALVQTLLEREPLGARARAAVDGRGLARIADIICRGARGVR